MYQSRLEIDRNSQSTLAATIYSSLLVDQFQQSVDKLMNEGPVSSSLVVFHLVVEEVLVKLLRYYEPAEHERGPVSAARREVTFLVSR